MNQEPFRGRQAACSSSEFGVETDAESRPNPVGSTIAHALDAGTLNPLLGAGESTWQEGTVRVASTKERIQHHQKLPG